MMFSSGPRMFLREVVADAENETWVSPRKVENLLFRWNLFEEVKAKKSLWAYVVDTILSPRASAFKQRPTEEEPRLFLDWQTYAWLWKYKYPIWLITRAGILRKPNLQYQLDGEPKFHETYLKVKCKKPSTNLNRFYKVRIVNRKLTLWWLELVHLFVLKQNRLPSRPGQCFFRIQIAKFTVKDILVSFRFSELSELELE